MEITHVSEYEDYNQGITFFDHGLFEEAIAKFNQVLESVHGDKAPERRLASFYICEAYINLGLTHLRMEMYRRAEEDLKNALAIHSEYADLHFHLATVYYRQKQYDYAERQLQRALGVNPKFARALIYLGLIRLRQGDTEGLADIAEAVTIEPAYNDEKFQDALSIYHEGKVERAIKLIEEVADIDVDQISFLLDKGRKLMKQKVYLDASNAFLEAASICPHYADIRNCLGMCYLQQGMMDLAVGQLKKAIEINPEFISARLNLATVYEKDGDKDLSVQELKRVLRMDPSNQVAEKMLSKLSNSS